MSSICLSLDYQANLNQYYQKFVDLPGFVLLESSDQHQGRYDILSALPYETIQIPAREAVSTKIFKDLQAKIPQTAPFEDLPFQGGLIGFFSYDLAQKLANIILNPKQSLVELPLIAAGLYDWAIIVDHWQKKVSLFAANTQGHTPGLVQEMRELWQAPHEPDAEGFSLKSSLEPLITRQAYEQAFHSIYTDLQKGRCYQVNYTQAFSATFQGKHWAMYESIKQGNPVPYSAFLRFEQADILCFSPERFMTINQGSMLTSPIKGTARRVANPVEDAVLAKQLQNCPKNRAENLMIVDLMRNDFGKIAKTGSVKVEALCQLESYELVHHLVSHIRAECLPDLSPLEAFGACFPGGSITGAPKLEAERVIAEQEAYNRGVYCGSIGYVSGHGRLDMNIAIRSLTLAEGRLHLAVGGGIVIDSDCEEEYEECLIKMAAICRGLYKK